MPRATRATYKALYEQQLKKNKEHEEKIDELESEIVDLVDPREIAKWAGEDPEDYMHRCCAYTLATKIKEHKELKEENKKLKDFTNWENHPALKHKVVIDDDWYLQHLNEEGQPIDADEVRNLKEKLEKLRAFIEGLREAIEK